MSACFVNVQHPSSQTSYQSICQIDSFGLSLIVLSISLDRYYPCSTDPISERLISLGTLDTGDTLYCVPKLYPQVIKNRDTAKWPRLCLVQVLELASWLSQSRFVRFNGIFPTTAHHLSHQEQQDMQHYTQSVSSWVPKTACPVSLSRQLSEFIFQIFTGAKNFAWKLPLSFLQPTGQIERSDPISSLMKQ